jgi:hypothetical protein
MDVGSREIICKWLKENMSQSEKIYTAEMGKDKTKFNVNVR